MAWTLKNLHAPSYELICVLLVGLFSKCPMEIYHLYEKFRAEVVFVCHERNFRFIQSSWLHKIMLTKAMGFKFDFRTFLKVRVCVQFEAMSMQHLWLPWLSRDVRPSATAGSNILLERIMIAFIGWRPLLFPCNGCDICPLNNDNSIWTM